MSVEFKMKEGKVVINSEGKTIGSVNTDSVKLSVQAQLCTITPNDYQALAMRTMNDKLTKDHLLINSALGLAGETGEYVDHIKKHVHQGHILDRNHLINELGDILWYVAEAATVLDTTIEDIMMGNINKLKARYPQGFKEIDSVARLDQ